MAATTQDAGRPAAESTVAPALVRARAFDEDARMTAAPLALHPKTSALLVMDFQTAIVENLLPCKDELARAGRVLESARKAGMRVVYVVVAFRAGYPEVSPRNLSLSSIRESG